MKRSEKQIQASRLNGAKSRGPVTEEGRRNSRRAAWRQNILARSVVLPCESRERFNELYNSLMAEIQPSTPTETLLVSRMTVAQWRQMRLWSLEKSILASESGSFPERASLYETRYDRQFDRALATIDRRRSQQKRLDPTTGSKQSAPQLP
jgi:hypothetical protein